MKKYYNFTSIILISTFTIVIAFAIFIFFNSSINTIDKKSEFKKINSNIKIKNIKTNEEYIKNLPCKLPSGTYSFSFKASPFLESNTEELYIFIRSVYSSYSINYDEKVIFEFKSDADKIVKSTGVGIKLIKVPNEYINKNIEIIFSPMTNSSYGIRIPCIYLCNSNNMLIDNINNKASSFLYAAILLVFAIESFLFFIYFSINKKISLRYLLLPLFAIIVAIYLIIETPIMYYFFRGRGDFIYILEYVFLLSMPIPPVLFIINTYRYEKSHTLYYKVLVSIFYTLIINLIVQITLTYFKIFEFIDMQKSFLIIIFAILIFFLLTPLIENSFRFIKRKQIIIFLVVILLFVITALDYSINSKVRFLPIIGISSIIFISIQILIGIKYYEARYNDIYTTKLYKKIALHDSFTTLLNRAALENDLNNIKKSHLNKNLLLMVIDINNLKQVNDLFGHEKGDEVIIETSKILLNVNNTFKNIKAYRVGGDEFIIMGIDIIDNLGNEINTFIEAKSKEVKNLSLAVGFDTHKLTKDFNLYEFIEKIDKKMYDKKEKMKNTIYDCKKPDEV